MYSDTKKLFLSLFCTGCAVLEYLTRDDEYWANIVTTAGYGACGVLGLLLCAENLHKLRLAGKLSAKSFNKIAKKNRDTLFREIQKP